MTAADLRRREFEKWARNEPYGYNMNRALTPLGERYESDITDTAWDAWNAALDAWAEKVREEATQRREPDALDDEGVERAKAVFQRGRVISRGSTDEQKVRAIIAAYLGREGERK